VEEKGSERFTSHLHSLRKQDWDKRLTGVSEFAAAELGATIHQNGENGNGASSVVHRGFGVAEEPHNACR
jgi:hypothetical protein